jgi:hypothetical protein
MFPRSSLISLTLGLLLTGCAGTAAQVSNASPTVDPGSTPSTSLAGQTFEPTATPDPTVLVTQPPALVATVEVTHTFMKPWKDSIGSIEYEIVVEVQNTGTAPAEISSGSNDYTIYDTSGGVLDTGSFLYAMPQVLLPGDFGYYVDSGFFDDGTALKSVGKAEPSVQYSEATETPGVFEVTKVKVAKEAYGTGLQVSGVVKNAGTEAATQPFVGVILFDGSGNVLGALYENSLENLAAGQSKGFKSSYPGTPPLTVTQVKSFKTFGYDFDFFF